MHDAGLAEALGQAAARQAQSLSWARAVDTLVLR
jgi:hypothetical protein